MYSFTQALETDIESIKIAREKRQHAKLLSCHATKCDILRVFSNKFDLDRLELDKSFVGSI